MTIRILLLLFRCRLSYWFGGKDKYAIAYRSLVSTHTYRLSDGDHSNPLILGRYIRLALMTSRNQFSSPIIEGLGTAAVFGGEMDEVLRYKEYLKGLTDHDPSIYFARNGLSVQKSRIRRLGVFLGVFALSFTYIFHALIGNRSANYAMIIMEWAEWMNIITIVQRHKIDHIFLFDSYEKDANMISLILGKLGVHTNRIPAENTLTTYYREVICDQFSYTTPFQRDERKQFRNWIVGEEVDYPCFNYRALLQANTSQNEDSERTIGFISSGVWRRIERGDQAKGGGEYESEELLITVLHDFLKQNPEFKLLIYLHPCERETEALYAKAFEHYKEIFTGVELELLPFGMGSLDGFRLSNVAVSVYSSANMERLFLKMKTLYFPACFSYKLYDGTSLDRICGRSEQELLDLLERSMNMSNDAFFEHFGLQNYPRFGLKN